MNAQKVGTLPAAAAHRPIRCPQKTGINLNMHEKRAGAVLTVVIGCLVIALLAGAAAKLGVIDRYQRLAQAEQAYAQVHGQYTAMEEALADYDAVLSEYRTYSMDWQAGADGTVTVNRRLVLDLIEQEMMTRGTVTSLRVMDDAVVVVMTGMSLAEISEMFEAIEAQPIVKSVELTLAETERDQPASVLSFSVNITLQEEAAQ